MGRVRVRVRVRARVRARVRVRVSTTGVSAPAATRAPASLACVARGDMGEIWGRYGGDMGGI